jgi:hypothetical protein
VGTEVLDVFQRERVGITPMQGFHETENGIPDVGNENPYG